MRRFIGLLIIMFIMSILGGILFPPKTKVNIKVNIEKKEITTKDIERHTNKEAIDL